MIELLLICGIPGTGKSTFGRWLRDNRKFTFVDMEAQPTQPDSLEINGLRTAWDAFYAGLDRVSFINELYQRAPVALDWGFPVREIPTVQALVQAGVVPWWFDGDPLVARSFFELRGTVPMACFDQQYSAISAHWSLIAPLLGDRVIKVARTDGTLLTPAEIYEIIQVA